MHDEAQIDSIKIEDLSQDSPSTLKDYQSQLYGVKSSQQCRGFSLIVR